MVMLRIFMSLSTAGADPPQDSGVLRPRCRDERDEQETSVAGQSGARDVRGPTAGRLVGRDPLVDVAQGVTARAALDRT